jgi:hypothetical protein
MSFVPGVGLCSVCRHVKITGNRRGSRFYLCGRSAADPSFRRYPGLPVLACGGFEPHSPQSDADPREEIP